MIHRGLLFWSVAAIGTAIGLFSVKYRVQDLEEKIDRTNQKIIESQQATHILQIEWAHLNEAERIERLAQKHLKLEQASIKQVVRLDSLHANRTVRQHLSPRDANRHSLPPHVRATTSPRRLCPVAIASQRRPAAPRRPPHPSAFHRTHDAPSTGLSTRAGTMGPAGDEQRAAASIDEILSRNEEVRR